MVRRYIAIFPTIPAHDPIVGLRQQYDPLGYLVRPHITLVFPFESTLSKMQVSGHVQDVLRQVRSFSVSLDAVSIHDDYVFLNASEGRSAIIELHDRLYGGLLAPYLRSDIPYLPHMTVARCADPSALQRAYDLAVSLPRPYKFQVDRIQSMLIEANERMEEFESSISLAVTPNKS